MEKWWVQQALCSLKPDSESWQPCHANTVLDFSQALISSILWAVERLEIRVRILRRVESFTHTLNVNRGFSLCPHFVRSLIMQRTSLFCLSKSVDGCCTPITDSTTGIALYVPSCGWLLYSENRQYNRYSPVRAQLWMAVVLR